MDLSKRIESKAAKRLIWIFNETFKENKEIIAEFVEAKELIANDGKQKIPVLCLLGKTDKFVGDLALSVWRMTLSDKLVETIGAETNIWKTPLLKLTAGENNKIIVDLA